MTLTINVYRHTAFVVCLIALSQRGSHLTTTELTALRHRLDTFLQLIDIPSDYPIVFLDEYNAAATALDMPPWSD